MKKIFFDFFSFIKRPADQKYFDQRPWFKIKTLLYFMLLLIITDILTSILRYSIEHVFSLDPVNRLDPFADNFFITFFWFCIFAPITEEIAFRLHLKFRSLNLWLSYSFLSAFFLRLSYKINIFLFIAIAILIFILTLLLVLERKRIHIKLKWFWSENFWFVYYFSSILFGFLHFGNYQFEYKNLPFIFVIVLPQTIAGLFLGYLRIKFGIIWSIFLHFLNNSIILIPLLFVYYITGSSHSKPIQHKENYKTDNIKVGGSSPVNEINTRKTHSTFIPMMNRFADVLHRPN